MEQIINKIKNNGIDNNHIIILNKEGKSGEGIDSRKKLEILR